MIYIKVDKDLKQLFFNIVGNCLIDPIKIYNNMFDDKSLIVSELKNKSSIYLIHNLVPLWGCIDASRQLGGGGQMVNNM